MTATSPPVPNAQQAALTFMEEEPVPKAFPYPLPKDGTQQFLSGIPLPLLYPGFLAAIGAAGLAGSVVGRAAPGEISLWSRRGGRAMPRQGADRGQRLAFSIESVRCRCTSSTT